MVSVAQLQNCDLLVDALETSDKALGCAIERKKKIGRKLGSGSNMQKGPESLSSEKQ